MPSQRSDLLEDRDGFEILLQVMADEADKKGTAFSAGLAVEPEAPELFQGKTLGLAEDKNRAGRKGSNPAAGAVGRAEEGASRD
jgi:hypothetical protein